MLQEYFHYIKKQQPVIACFSSIIFCHLELERAFLSDDVMVYHANLARNAKGKKNSNIAHSFDVLYTSMKKI